MSDFGEAAKDFALQLTHSFFLDFIPPNYSVRLNRELEKVADVMGIDLNTLKTCYRRLPPLPQLPLRGPPLRLPLPSPCHHRLHCGDEHFIFSFTYKWPIWVIIDQKKTFCNKNGSKRTFWSEQSTDLYGVATAN